MTMDEVNALDTEQFVEKVGWVYEHSPWVAARVWPRRPFAGLTALRTLRYGGPLIGRRVLITGAAGGVGTLAVQIAARSGAHVTAVENQLYEGRADDDTVTHHRRITCLLGRANADTHVDRYVRDRSRVGNDTLGVNCIG